ncbi:MAG: ABC transporter ATP-binding protein [Anaerolinea sp.]|nr:ABC transporter ATP-binding protein [Anaerolinea sp.]MCC6976057.1 ABC transporter ATP-binding protein [Anaerolineae bacterium]
MTIRTENIAKHYGGIPVLKGINLNITEGEYVAIMGPSGSGKSTLLHLIGGIDRPTEGRVWLQNHDLSALTDDQLATVRRRQIGFIFQIYNLIPVINARENVAMPLIIDGVKRQDALKRATAVLNIVGLQDHAEAFPGKLSGGQQQRVAIARALVIEPSIILADEPTGALDTRTGDEIMALLRQTIHQTRCTILVVTHDPRIAARTDRIITIRDGEIVDDTPLKRNAHLSGSVLTG